MPYVLVSFPWWIQVGVRASNTIESSSDVDVATINLEAGQYYTVNVQGFSSRQGTLLDPYLDGVYYNDTNNNALAPKSTDDNSGTGLDSRATFYAPYKGEYYIVAEGGGTGTYSILVTEASHTITPPIVQNNAPTISLDTIVDELAENADTTSRIKLADVTVNDDSTGTNLLTIRGSDTGVFELDGTELFLRAGAVLDYEDEAELDVFVLVDDPSLGQGWEDREGFTLDVTDANDAPEVALENVVTALPENTYTEERVKVADIVVTDDALGSEILTLSGADAGRFEIDGTELFLRVLKALDFESDPAFEVTVEVDDTTVGATPDDTASLALAVTDVNEAAEVILVNVVTGLAETPFLGSRLKVADVLITNDALGVQTLSLSGPDALAFELDGLSLFLKAGRGFDFETTPALSVSVDVADPSVPGSSEISVPLLLPIIDVNDRPSLALANVTAGLAEDTDTTLRTKIAVIDVTDDALGTNMVSLAGADASLFEIDGTELFLQAGTSLDFESAPQLDVTVTLEDAAFAGLEGSEGVALSITDVNELPSVALLDAVTALAEDADTSVRIKVADIVVTDDALGVNTLGLSGADAALFEIEGMELFLRAGALLDIETTPRLDVVVTINDPVLGTDPNDSDGLVLEVTDVNEPPNLVLANVLAGLPEDTNTSVRVKIADIVITDDALGINTLALTGADAALFEIDGTELFLQAGTSLDFESDSQLDMAVTLDDAAFAGLEGSEDVALSVTDVNEVPAVTLINAVTALAEDADTSARIKVADIDVTNDALGTNTLALTGVDAALFELDGTALYLRPDTALDFETAPSLNVSVAIDDPDIWGSPDGSDGLALAVTDVNEAPELRVSQTVTALTEHADTTTRIAVAILAINDDALGTNALGLAGEDTSFFEIGGLVLYLRSDVALDNALTPELDVTITLGDASLGAGIFDSVALVIKLPDTDQAGSPGNDLLIGTPFNDRIFGLEGDDTLVGRENNDVLDGGPGTDVVVFQAPPTRYTITLSPGGITVDDRSLGVTGTDTVIDIETLRFSSNPEADPEIGTDIRLSLFEGALDVTTDQLASLIHLYIGLYDRAPEALGLFYWATQLVGGLSFDAITQAFIDSPEAIALYGAAPTNAEIVEGAYENLLDRASDPDGAAFWTRLLDDEIITPATFFELFLGGVDTNPSAGDDRETLADQVDIGIYYAVISGLSDASEATDVLAAYDSAKRTESLLEAQSLIDAFAADAMSPDTGDLIVQLMGVIDDPFVMP